MAGWRRNGFTLIEMLIAMTLLGIMVVLLFSSLKIAAESWNAGESKLIEVNRKAVVYQFFKRHLTTIRPVLFSKPVDYIGEPSLPQILFEGHKNTLRFVSSLPISAKRKGLQIFDIAPDPQNSATLMVGLSPYQQIEQVEAEKVVLLENIAVIQFSYFGKLEEGSIAVWQDDWAVANSLPQLIKISIALHDGSYWPDMVFPIRINTQANASSVQPINSADMAP
jgi:general secretion pathway protein J